MTALILLLGLVVALFIYFIVIYNSLVGLHNRVNNGFSQIDVQLQRRYDLIPNLVEAAKAFMAHERTTLEAVIQARNSAKAAAIKVGENPSDAQAMQKLAGAESALGSALSRFFALSEDYPELKSNEQMILLHEELASTENRVAFARQAFNDAVTEYNIKREIFPNSLVANRYRFKRAEQLQLDDADTRKPLKVSFQA